MPHHLTQQSDEQFGVQSAFICAIPESPLGVHRGRRADRLSLPRPLDDWRLPLLAPGLSVNGIRPEARLIPEKPLSARCPRPPRATASLMIANAARSSMTR